MPSGRAQLELEIKYIEHHGVIADGVFGDSHASGTAIVWLMTEGLREIVSVCFERGISKRQQINCAAKCMEDKFHCIEPDKLQTLEFEHL